LIIRRWWRPYRFAHAIIQRDQQHLTTEELRHAIVYFRSLFDDVLESEVRFVGRRASVALNESDDQDPPKTLCAR
jgi:hypothetical protein